MKIFLSWHNNTDMKFSCKSPFEDLFIQVSNSEEGQMAAILTEVKIKTNRRKLTWTMEVFLWYLALYTKPKCNSTNKLYK